MHRDVHMDRIELATTVTARLSAALEADSVLKMLVECAGVLSDLIGADEVLLTQLDLANPRGTVVASGPQLVPHAELTSELMQTGRTHPAVLSYLRAGDDRRPRRVSDVATVAAWRRHLEASSEFRAHGGTHQLSIVTTLTATQGRGWILTREGRDFTDAEVEVAAQLLPGLSVLDRAWALGLLGRARTDGGHPPALPAVSPSLSRNGDRAGFDCARVGPCPSLTRRQIELLRLLARGLSARLMARELGITERTVNKHLQMLYRRLGAHDRVTALLHAQQFGLLHR